LYVCSTDGEAKLLKVNESLFLIKQPASDPAAQKEDLASDNKE